MLTGRARDFTTTTGNSRHNATSISFFNHIMLVLAGPTSNSVQETTQDQGEHAPKCQRTFCKVFFYFSLYICVCVPGLEDASTEGGGIVEQGEAEGNTNKSW